jgi:hypothetical protein
VPTVSAAADLRQAVQTLAGAGLAAALLRSTCHCSTAAAALCSSTVAEAR